jgi:hypothetical protein
VRLLIHRRRRRARRRAGFWLASWQGLITPITFVISLFNDEANIYEVNNNGNWYDLGFILGVAIVFSGPAGALAPSQGAHGPAARSPDALRTVHGHHRTPIHPPRNHADAALVTAVAAIGSLDHRRLMGRPSKLMTPSIRAHLIRS